MKNIGYHTRSHDDNSRKIVGGTFAGKIDAETVDALVDAQFNVTVLNSGMPVFVDSHGRRVFLYINVMPLETTKGREAVSAWNEKRESEAQAERVYQADIRALLDSMSSSEAIRRLKAE